MPKATHRTPLDIPIDCGLLLVGHGSKDRSGVDEFLALARLVARRIDPRPVEPCFLEFARPTIADGFRALVGRRARQIVVVPTLLFAAEHAKRDIPRAVEALAREFPKIRVTQAAHLGCHEALLELSQTRFEEARPRLGSAPAEQTALVLVGRGSRDAQAIAEFLEFLALRQLRSRLAIARASFLAMAQPSLEHVLSKIAGLQVGRVIVQPHLIFGGVLDDRIRQIVARQAQLCPPIQWLTTAPLGADSQVARALVDRGVEAFRRPESSPRATIDPGTL